MNRILVIDDDIELCELLTEYLYPQGFEVVAAHQAQAGLGLALAKDHDLVILDVMLPGLNGFEVLGRIRAAHCSVPVLMLTARGEEMDRITGLEMGADDYLAKPFNPRELLARIRAIQRRSESPAKPDIPWKQTEPLTVGDICLDPGARTIVQHQTHIPLTTVEFSLLHELMKRNGQVVSREELTRRVLERKLTVFDRSIDVHISSLRKKLGHELNHQERIKTIRGVGYLYIRPSS
jgi:two-component system response regulator CpxR